MRIRPDEGWMAAFEDGEVVTQRGDRCPSGHDGLILGPLPSPYALLSPRSPPLPLACSLHRDGVDPHCLCRRRHLLGSSQDQV